MSLTSATSVLVSSLVNFQNAIQVTSNNIANANTVGYSREVAQFAENIPQSINGQQYGSGSYISTVERLRDIYLDSQIRAELTQVGYNSTMNVNMQELSAIFPDIASPGAAGGISTLLTNFYSAWSSLASNPASNAAKEAVIVDGEGLSNQLRQTMQSLTTLRTSLDSQVTSVVNTVNSLINQIAAYNGQIKSNPGASASIEDSREQAMQNLAGLINAQFITTSDGTVTVLFGKGTLVSGTIASDFNIIKGLPDPTLVKIGFPANAGSSATDVTSAITGGQLGALLQSRDTVVQNAIFAVQAIGTGLIQNTNLIYHAASNSSGAHANFFDGDNSGDITVDPVLSGSTTGSALLSSFTPTSTAGGLAAAMAGSQNAYTASYVQSVSGIAASYSGSAAINAQPAIFPLPFSASGTIHIDLSSGSAAIVNWTNSQSLSTIAANITSALAGAGTAVYDESTQKFTILTDQPVSLYDSSGNLATVLQLTSFLNSATNINATIDPSIGQGSGSEQLTSNAALINYFNQVLPKGTYTVDNSNVNWTDTQSITGITNNVIFSTAFNVIAYFDVNSQQVIQYKNVSSPTAANPLTSFTGADATGNFAKLAAIMSPSSLANTYAGISANVSQQLSLSSAQQTASQGVLNDLQGIQDGISKVNLDTEAAQAIQYKDAYEASLRVISVIDDMLNVLINQTAAPASSVSSSSLVN